LEPLAQAIAALHQLQSPGAVVLGRTAPAPTTGVTRSWSHRLFRWRD